MKLTQKMTFELSFDEAMAVRDVLGQATGKTYRNDALSEAGSRVYECLNRHLPAQDAA